MSPRDDCFVVLQTVFTTSFLRWLIVEHVKATENYPYRGLLRDSLQRPHLDWIQVLLIVIQSLLLTTAGYLKESLVGFEKVSVEYCTKPTFSCIDLLCMMELYNAQEVGRRAAELTNDTGRQMKLLMLCWIRLCDVTGRAVG